MPSAQLNGIEIHYEESGAGTPLVLTHGYSASLAMWAEQVPVFAEKYRVVTYDTRGHGQTTAPSNMEQYGLATDSVADLLALMDHLEIGEAYVGGLSMGGMIAQEFALQHADRVKALLLFDTGPGMGGAGRDPALMAQFAKMREMMQTLARTKGMGAIIDAMRSRADTFRPPSGAPVPEAVRTHMRNMAQMSVDGYLGGSKSMQDWSGTRGRLSQITAPTLVLVGEHDNLLGASREIHREIAGSRFVLVRNSGHGTNLWRADAFAAETLDFLAAVDKGEAVAGEFVVA